MLILFGNTSMARKLQHENLPIDGLSTKSSKFPPLPEIRCQAASAPLCQRTKTCSQVAEGIFKTKSPQHRPSTLGVTVYVSNIIPPMKCADESACMPAPGDGHTLGQVSFIKYASGFFKGPPVRIPFGFKSLIRGGFDQETGAVCQR